MLKAARFFIKQREFKLAIHYLQKVLDLEREKKIEVKGLRTKWSKALVQSMRYTMGRKGYKVQAHVIFA